MLWVGYSIYCVYSCSLPLLTQAFCSVYVPLLLSWRLNVGLNSLVLCVCPLHPFILAKVLCCLRVHLKLVTGAEPSLWLMLSPRRGWALTVVDAELSPWLMLSSHRGCGWLHSLSSRALRMEYVPLCLPHSIPQKLLCTSAASPVPHFSQSFPPVLPEQTTE